MENIIIGIDLGTTYSCVGVVRRNKVEILPNDVGNFTTPSIVGFTETKRCIGEAAKHLSMKYYKNTIYDSKRLIGKKFDDPEIQKDIKFWPFKIEKDIKYNDRPLIVIEYKNKIEKFYPEDISAMILSKLKEIAENFLGMKVKDAVITVPAYFNQSQRIATKDAGRIAGLNVLQILNEPSAAAIAYGLNNRSETKRNILVFDFGGGTCDASILTINDSIFEVKGTYGDNHLGGQDIDNILIEYCIEQFKGQTGIDISNNQKAIRRLKIYCENAKTHLSSFLETSIELDSLANGEDFYITIARPLFDKLCEKIFNRCMIIIKQSLINARMNKDEIDDIIVTGGSSRIPKILEMIKDYFNGKYLYKNIHPDETVAYGAAIYASELIENKVGLEKLILIDVLPLSLGLELYNGKMDYIFKRNTPIPCFKTQMYKTIRDNQERINIKIYEGERIIVKKNFKIGEILIDKIPPRPAGAVKVKVTFNIDSIGLLLVTGELIDSNERKVISIRMENNYSEKEIEKKIEEAYKMNKEDEKEIMKITENIKKKNLNNFKDYDDLIDRVQDKYLSLSLGIQLITGEMKKIIERNSKIPISRDIIYDAEINKENQIIIKIYQGERILALGNFLLKTIKISLKEKRKNKLLRLKIIFELNENLILKITVQMLNEENLIFETEINNEFEEEYIEDKIRIAENMKNDDLKIIKDNNSKFEFLTYLNKMNKKLNDAYIWYENHQKESYEVYNKMLNDLKNI